MRAISPGAMRSQRVTSGCGADRPWQSPSRSRISGWWVRAMPISTRIRRLSAKSISPGRAAPAWWRRNHGVMRLYARKSDGRFLGAEFCAPAGEHMAHLLGLAATHGMRVCEMLAMPFYHPVLEEGLRTALRDLDRQLPDEGRSDLAQCPATGDRGAGVTALTGESCENSARRNRTKDGFAARIGSLITSS